jgi:predicted GIY-YIG superfamily endonuclease
VSIVGPHYPDNLAHLADKPHFVYVVWADDEPLYVGMTSDWMTRTGHHLHYFRPSEFRASATHIDVWECAESRYEAELIERDVIRALDPRDNSRHSPRCEAAAEARAIEDEIVRRWRALPIHVREPDLWKRMQDAIDSLPVLT